MYDKEQNFFLNAVARYESDEKPDTCLLALQEIENALGKNTLRTFGPRTIDLDILLCGDLTISVGARHAVPLQVPHPRMHERRFVLDPLCELINPKSLHPVLKKSWSALRKSVGNQECTKINLVL